MIAVDWGTSSLRAYRLDADGIVLERTAAPLGIMQVSDGAFAQALESQIGPWLQAGESRILMSGMIGARQGWAEAPYCECPAGLAQIAARLKSVQWGAHQAWIAPGVSTRGGDGVPDVMRGEEMQILGAADTLPARSGLVCLPGTHSKWVVVEDACITRFSTHMTGEVFALLRQHSILGRMMRVATVADTAQDDAAFGDGVARARQDGGLLHHLFGVRARGLFGELEDTHSAAYLSGLLIGHELRAALGHAPVSSLHVLGTPELTRLYSLAAAVFGVEARALDAESAVRGLHRLSNEVQPFRQEMS